MIEENHDDSGLVPRSRTVMSSYLVKAFLAALPLAVACSQAPPIAERARSGSTSIADEDAREGTGSSFAGSGGPLDIPEAAHAAPEKEADESKSTMGRIEVALAGTDRDAMLNVEGIGDVSTTPKEVTAEEIEALVVATEGLSLDDLRARSRLPSGEYLVEGDILLANDEQLSSFYYEVYAPSRIDPSGKLIVELSGGFFFYALRLPSTDIKYCFHDDWSGVTGGLAGVKAGLKAAMRAWEGVARVKFVHATTLDGPGCTTSGSNPGVSFVVKKNGMAGTATGPFPDLPWAQQILGVPNAGLPEDLATHEMGHALGFRHEHIHTKASPRCTGEGSLDTLEELFLAWDPVSVMGYKDCTVGLNIEGGRRISRMDGVGARKMYLAPDWWWSALI